MQLYKVAEVPCIRQSFAHSIQNVFKVSAANRSVEFAADWVPKAHPLIHIALGIPWCEGVLVGGNQSAVGSADCPAKPGSKGGLFALRHGSEMALDAGGKSRFSHTRSGKYAAMQHIFCYISYYAHMQLE